MRYSNRFVGLGLFILLAIVLPEAQANDYLTPEFDPPRYSNGQRFFLQVSEGISWESDERRIQSSPAAVTNIALEYFFSEGVAVGYQITDARFSLKNNPHHIADMTVNTFMLTFRINFTAHRRIVPFIRGELGGATATRPGFIYVNAGSGCRTQFLRHSRINNLALGVLTGVMYAFNPRVYLNLTVRSWTTFSLRGAYLTPAEFVPAPFGYVYCSLPYFSYSGLDFSATELRLGLSLKL